MSSDAQTWVALLVVAIAAVALVWRIVAKRRNPGCGSDCGAISPEVKRLQAHLRRSKS